MEFPGKRLAFLELSEAQRALVGPAGGSTRSGLQLPGELPGSGKGPDWVRIWHNLGQSRGLEGIMHAQEMDTVF